MSSLFDELKAEEVKEIKDGSYTGVIGQVLRDTENFDYTRYIIKLDDTEQVQDMTLNVSYPTRLTFLNSGKPSSQHSKFLVRMGFEYKKDAKMGEYIEGLVNRKVTFLVQQKVTDNGTFAEIVKESVKPI